jgi:hypothetical protein
MTRKFDIDLDQISHDELKAAYKRLYDSRNSLQQHNGNLTKWASRINDAVTTLTTEGSLVFQAMAEKAGVRGHPTVTEAVRLFDSISHPQWSNDEPPPKIEWPTDWSFTGDNWSGDADMALNAPIAEAMEKLRMAQHSVNKDSIYYLIDAAVADLLKAMRRGVEGIKEQHGFKPVHLTMPTGKHPNDMTEKELREAVSIMGMMALDLAQDMDFAGFMLRRDLRASTYRRVHGDLYRLAFFDFGNAKADPQITVKVFGGEQVPF